MAARRPTEDRSRESSPAPKGHVAQVAATSSASSGRRSSSITGTLAETLRTGRLRRASHGRSTSQGADPSEIFSPSPHGTAAQVHGTPPPQPANIDDGLLFSPNARRRAESPDLVGSSPNIDHLDEGVPFSPTGVRRAEAVHTTASPAASPTTSPMGIAPRLRQISTGSTADSGLVHAGGPALLERRRRTSQGAKSPLMTRNFIRELGALETPLARRITQHPSDSAVVVIARLTGPLTLKALQQAVAQVHNNWVVLSAVVREHPPNSDHFAAFHSDPNTALAVIDIPHEALGESLDGAWLAAHSVPPLQGDLHSWTATWSRLADVETQKDSVVILQFNSALVDPGCALDILDDLIERVSDAVQQSSTAEAPTILSHLSPSNSPKGASQSPPPALAHANPGSNSSSPAGAGSPSLKKTSSPHRSRQNSGAHGSAVFPHSADSFGLVTSNAWAQSVKAAVIGHTATGAHLTPESEAPVPVEARTYSFVLRSVDTISTYKINRRCRDHTVSLTAALAAALFLAVGAHLKKSRLAISAPQPTMQIFFNMRLCKNAGELPPDGNFVNSFLLQHRPGQLWQDAGNIQKELQKRLDHPLVDHTPKYFSTLAELSEAVQTPTGHGLLPCLSTSMLGRTAVSAPGPVKPAEIFYTTIQKAVGYDLNLTAVLSHSGRLCLSLGFAPHVFSEQKAKALLEDVVQLLHPSSAGAGVTDQD